MRVWQSVLHAGDAQRQRFAAMAREEASSGHAKSRTQESASSSLPEYGSPREVYKAKTASRSLEGTSKET